MPRSYQTTRADNGARNCWCGTLLEWLSRSASSSCERCSWKRHREGNKENEPSHGTPGWRGPKRLSDWCKSSGHLIVKNLCAGHCCRMINELQKRNSEVLPCANHMPKWTRTPITRAVIWSWDHGQGSWAFQSLPFVSPVFKMLITF